MKDNSVSLYKVIKVAPEKLFRAFSDPLAHANWLPPYGFLCSVQQFDFCEGGAFKMTFTNFTTGNSHSFHGAYMTIKDNRFINYVDRFDDPSLPGEITTSIWFEPVAGGTGLKILQEGIPAAIPISSCYMGWQDSLDKLTKLVEPEIPDA